MAQIIVLKWTELEEGIQRPDGISLHADLNKAAAYVRRLESSSKLGAGFRDFADADIRTGQVGAWTVQVPDDYTSASLLEKLNETDGIHVYDAKSGASTWFEARMKNVVKQEVRGQRWPDANLPIVAYPA